MKLSMRSYLEKKLTKKISEYNDLFKKELELRLAMNMIDKEIARLSEQLRKYDEKDEGTRSRIRIIETEEGSE